jgi:conserved hypothetical protein
MKFGFRTPSFKRSLSAATKGAAKRALMREIVPYYGKRGMGWSNPKKAAYNHLYSMTTASPIDLLTNTSSRRTAAVKPQMSEAEYQEKLSALQIRQIGLKQCETPMALFKMIENDDSNGSPVHQAIRRLHSYVLGYMNKPMKCGFDYCEMCNERLLKLQRINPEVKEICLNIVKSIKQGLSAAEIFDMLTGAMPKQSAGLDSIFGTIWTANINGKCYVLEFELPSVVLLYVADPVTLAHTSNSSCGFGYSVESDYIVFSGGTTLTPACNFIKGELNGDSLNIRCSVLSSECKWEDKHIVFKRTVKRSPMFSMSDVKTSESVVASTSTETANAIPTNLLLPSNEIMTQPIAVNDNTNDDTKSKLSTKDIRKIVGVIIVAIARVALLIWLISNFIPLLIGAIVFIPWLGAALADGAK